MESQYVTKFTVKPLKHKAQLGVERWKKGDVLYGSRFISRLKLDQI